MKRAINIYVEGQGDLVFMCHFIRHRFKIDLEIKEHFLEANSKKDIQLNLSVLDVESGNGGIDNKKINTFLDEINRTVIPLGIDIVLLLDCDTPAHSNPPGGFQYRMNYLNKLKESTKFESFLIPNNSDDGNLESLLDKIISDKGKCFYDCLKKYTTCLSCLPCDKRPKAIKKTSDFNKIRMEWYTFMMMKGNNTNSGSKRDYSEDIWDLNSPSLLPLYEFLKKKLT